MNLSTLFEFAGPERWPEPASAFIDLLATLGVDTEWWARETDEQEAPSTEESAEFQQMLEERLAEFANDPSVLEEIVGAFVSVSQALIVGKVITDADGLIESGNVEEALRKYGQLLNYCSEAPAYAEAARLLLLRLVPQFPVGSVLSESDFNDESPYRGLADNDRLRKRAPIPPEAVDSVARLSLECYGRAYAWYSEAAREDVDLEEVLRLCTRACLALDGIRALFSSPQEMDSAELACWAYQAWDRAFNTAVSTSGLNPGSLQYWRYPGEVDFARRFEETMGYISGARIKNPVDRATARERLAILLGPTWPQLTKLPREYLVTAEILYEHLHPTLDGSPIVNEYSKAVEAALQDSFGRMQEGATMVAVLKAACDARRKRPVKSLARVALSTYKDAVEDILKNPSQRARFSASIKSLVPEGDDSWVVEFGKQLTDLVPTRTKADHAVQPGASWKVSREEAERVRLLCIGEAGLIHKLARLTPRGGEGG